MNTTLSRIHLTFDRSKLSGDRSDVKVIQEEMKVSVLQRERERESSLKVHTGYEENVHLAFWK